MVGETRVDGSPLKTVGALNPIQLLDEIALGAYGGALNVERRLLREGGMSEAEAYELVNRWREAKSSWHAAVDADTHPLVWLWGAASPSSLWVPGSKAVVQSCRAIGSELIGGISTNDGNRRLCGCCHGSSTTGFMGVWDRAWVDARKRFAEPDVPIFNIPLNWVAADFREIPAKNGAREHRCPPALRLSDRTDDFGRVQSQRCKGKPALVLVAPGGLGSRYELFWALLSAQLRKLLLTCFSGWNGNIPQVVLLDYELDLEERFDIPETPETAAARRKLHGKTLPEMFEARPGFAETIRRNRWVWDGIVDDMRRMVLAGNAGQEHIKHVSVLRLGEGESITSENRLGPRVIYFTSAAELGEFVGKQFDLAVA